MAQYIDKSALVAEIERRIECITKEYQESQQPEFFLLGKINSLENILPFLDTLKVKEVDFEKELDYNDYVNFFKEHPDYNDEDWGFEECWVFAQHFYELGLKVRDK